MSIISIIGSGGMAAAIGGRIAKAGHTVEVISRNPVKARVLADQLAVVAITGSYGSSATGDIVILAVRYTGGAPGRLLSFCFQGSSAESEPFSESRCW